MKSFFHRLYIYAMVFSCTSRFLRQIQFKLSLTLTTSNTFSNFNGIMLRFHTHLSYQNHRSFIKFHVTEEYESEIASSICLSISSIHTYHLIVTGIISSKRHINFKSRAHLRRWNTYVCN